MKEKDNVTFSIIPATQQINNHTMTVPNNNSISDVLSNPDRQVLSSMNNIGACLNNLNINDSLLRENTCIVSKEELNTMFVKNKAEYGKNKFGPKVKFKEYNMNKSFDSFEINLEFASSEEVFDIQVSKGEDNFSEQDNSKSSQSSKSRDESKKGVDKILRDDNIKAEVHNFNGLKTHNDQQDEQYMIKIDNSKNEFRPPSIYTRNLYTENNQSNNNIITTKDNEKRVSTGFCPCFQRNRKRIKSFQNTSTYSTGNVTHTKKSTNLSFKSLKLNDSLNKLRRRKSLSLNGEQLANNPNVHKEKIKCNCLIY